MLWTSTVQYLMFKMKECAVYMYSNNWVQANCSVFQFKIQMLQENNSMYNTRACVCWRRIIFSVFSFFFLFWCHVGREENLYSIFMSILRFQVFNPLSRSSLQVAVILQQTDNWIWHSAKKKKKIITNVKENSLNF